MEITEVRVSPSKGGKVRAFASIVIDDCFVVNDLRVLEAREGQFFVTMPARKMRNNQMRDIAHPLRSDTRKMIEERVLSEFRQAVANMAVPESSRQEKWSPLDRLSAKLFAEEYWTADLDREEASASEETEQAE